MASFWVLALALIAGVVSAERSSDRIIGGNITSVEEYPTIVQVDFNIFNWGQSCAGVILNSRNVLSAAHCFTGLLYFGPASRRCRSGSSLRNSGGILHYVSAVLNHPSYGSGSFDGDISIISLATPIIFDQVTRPVTIISQGLELPDNTPVIHAGWGTTENGNPSQQLRDVTIFTINTELCRQRYLELSSPAIVTDNMICAGILDIGGMDACQGDSGGPLYYQDILVGIVSWGYGCAHEYWPGVSAKVSPYTEWIVSNAN